MRIVSVVGTRPQLIQAAALSPVLRIAHDKVSEHAVGLVGMSASLDTQAENRERSRMADWTGLLDTAPTPQRPVVRALHLGTQATIDRAGLNTGPGVRVVAPQRYRVTLALQLHAAAVLTESGGIQREAAWLDVPCLVLRSTTEWVEAVAGGRGRKRVVDLNRPATLAALAGLAPASAGGTDVLSSASRRVIKPAGASAAIVVALSESAVELAR